MPTKSSAAGLVDALKLLAVMPAAGAGIGGLIGAARAEKGKRLRTALGDAGVGGMAGLGFALGGTAGGAAGMAMGGKSKDVADHQSAAMGGAGSALGAVGAGMLGQKLRKEMEEEYDIGNNPLSVVGKIGSHEDSGRLVFPSPLGLREQNVNPYHTAGIGAGAGALIGALKAPKGKMLKYTLGGAGIGGLSGGMGGVGWNFGNNSLGEDLSPLRLPIAIGGSALGAHLGNKMYDEVEDYIPEKKDKKEDKDMKKTEKKSAALAFGEKLAAGVDLKSIMNTGLGGAAIGAGLGGLAGLVAPGEDGTGKRRSRLSGALRGALGGGALGGGAAAIGEAASPGFGSSAYNYANDLYRQLYGRLKPKKPVLEPLVSQTGEMQTPDEYKKMLNNNLFYNETGRFNTPNAVSGNYLPDYGVPGGREGPPMG